MAEPGSQVSPAFWDWLRLTVDWVSPEPRTAKGNAPDRDAKTS